jgi:hypothetical protein
MWSHRYSKSSTLPKSCTYVTRSAAEAAVKLGRIHIQGSQLTLKAACAAFQRSCPIAAMATLLEGDRSCDVSSNSAEPPSTVQTRDVDADGAILALSPVFALGAVD